MAFHGPAQHVHQLLLSVVYTLATEPGDVRSRLLLASKVFFALTPEHFPEHLREDFEWAKEQLTKRSSVQATLKCMRNSTGAKIAQKLVALHYKIDEYVNPR